MSTSRESSNLAFSKSLYDFKNDQRLASLVADLQNHLAFTNHATSLIPTEGNRFDVGSRDRPYRGLFSRALSVQGTGTVQNGVLNIVDKGVIDCGTNSSMFIQPVYTAGNSPFNIWHPASRYMRDGALWLQKGSPAKQMVRAGGVDRILGIWDTTTCTYAGTMLWERDCSNQVFLSTMQFPDAESLTVQFPQEVIFKKGHPWINVKGWGATGDGTTDDIAAINLALAYAKTFNNGYGGIVFFPAGNYRVSEQIRVPSRVWIMGENSIATQITALSTFTTGTAIVRLGEGLVQCYNVRACQMLINANGVEGSSCVYSCEAEEWSGLFDVQLIQYRAYGANFEKVGAKLCSVMGVEKVGGYCADDQDATAHIRFSEVAGNSYIRDVSAASATVGKVLTDGIIVENSNVAISEVHVERCTDGIHLNSGTIGSIHHVTGHSSVTNLIHTEGFQVTLEAIAGASSENTLYDEYRAYIYTAADLGHINFLSLYHLNLGLVDFRSGTQTDHRELTVPNLGGANRTMAVEGVSNFSSFVASGVPKRMVVLNGTGVAPGVIGVNGFTLPDANNTASYTILPNQLTTDKTIYLPSEAHLSSYSHELTTDNAIQELRYKYLVDSYIKRNGQTSPFAWLSSADQTDTVEVRIPNFGTGGTFTPAFTSFTQTFTVKQEFTGEVVVTAPAVLNCGAAGGLILPGTLPSSDNAISIDAASGSLIYYWNGATHTVHVPA